MSAAEAAPWLLTGNGEKWDTSGHTSSDPFETFVSRDVLYHERVSISPVKVINRD